MFDYISRRINSKLELYFVPTMVFVHLKACKILKYYTHKKSVLYRLLYYFSSALSNYASLIIFYKNKSFYKKLTVIKSGGLTSSKRAKNSDELILLSREDDLFRFVPDQPEKGRGWQAKKFIESVVFVELQKHGYIPLHTNSKGLATDELSGSLYK